MKPAGFADVPPTERAFYPRLVMKDEAVRMALQLPTQFPGHQSKEAAAPGVEIHKRDVQIRRHLLHRRDAIGKLAPPLAGWRVDAHSQRSHENGRDSDSPRHRHVPGEALAIGAFFAQGKRCPIGLANLDENELRGLWRAGRWLAFRSEGLKMPAAGGISAGRGNGFANLLEATQGAGGFGSKGIIVPTPTADPFGPARMPRFVAHAM